MDILLLGKTNVEDFDHLGRITDVPMTLVSKADLAPKNVTELLPDPDAAEDNDLRIIDESGEDYLYEADRFVAIEVPTRLKRVLLKEFSQAGLGMR